LNLPSRGIKSERLRCGQSDGELREQLSAVDRVRSNGTFLNFGGPSRDSDEEDLFMKTKILSIFAAAVLMLALTFPASAPAAPPNGKPAPVTAQPAVPERHPEIHDALVSLRHAREHVEHAAHDFGGHRVEALRAIDEAIRQLEICQQYDK
jgi:hypothetical protein